MEGTALGRFLSGTGEVLSNMEKAFSSIVGKVSEEGMYEVLLLLERESKILTPVRTGNLISNYHTNVVKEQNAVVGILSNSTSYALYVHEMDPSFHYRKPGSGPKFVEIPLRKNQIKFLDILQRTSKV